MKKWICFISFLVLLLVANNSYSQTYRSSWNFGFGFSYPRFLSSDLRPLEQNYGGYLSIQRNFSEQVGIRLKGSYNQVQGRVPGGVFTYNNGAIIPSQTEEITTTLISGDLDLIYYIAPCSDVSPYLLFGLGAVYYDPDWTGINNTAATDEISAEVNIGLGLEWKLDNWWNLNTAISYHTTDGQVDGIVNNNRQGVFGSNADGYLTFDLGFMYYFSKGPKSNYCQLYDGISTKVEMPDLSNLATKDDVEEIVQRYIPEEVVKEVIVEKPVYRSPSDQKWVLIGANFNTGSANLRGEAYPVLLHAAQVLLLNPELNVEIQGHTDNVGSERTNQRLSEKRALTVKNYLVGKGVSASRLKTVGYGEKNPIASNRTADGRAMNRRIEFKVID
jgi:outer membrane protein OmpA-like peptidoglycan-associated protein